MLTRSRTWVLLVARRNIVSFDLLGSGKMSEQELRTAEGSELIALAIPRPMGIIFEERKLCAQARAVLGTQLVSLCRRRPTYLVEFSL